MGHITNQWLKNDAERWRERHYNPENVTIQIVEPYRYYNAIVAGDYKYVVQATRSNGDYHQIFFSRDDLKELLPKLTEGVDEQLRHEVALRILLELDASNLLAFLENLFFKRKLKNVNVATSDM